MTVNLPLLRCPRCGHTGDGEDRMAFAGCPACARDGRAVALVCDPPRHEPVPATGSAAGIWRWSETLPVARRHAVSLGEGDTPPTRPSARSTPPTASR